MDDLLKEAIADAKAVRETALENAKIALEEAFTPRLQSMLSKKIQSEIDVEEQEDEMEDEEEVEDVPEEGYMNDDDEDPTDAASEEEPEMDMEEDEEEMGDEEEMEEEGVIEINGVKYAPVVSEEEDEEGEEEVEDEMEESDDLDLEAVLRELEEDEVNEEDEVDEAKEEVDEEVDEEAEPVEEDTDKSSGIGKSDNHKGESDESSKEGAQGPEGEGSDKAAGHENSEDKVVKEDVEEEVNEEEDIDLEEVIAALSEEEGEDEKNEVAKIQSELDEHRNVVKYLRSKLNEVNLLNAKLLFTNKLFRSYGLTNDQKMKVVENFDRAHNLREVKLVYSTLAESFGTKPKNEIKESKGSASKAVASTKSEKQEVIAEGHEMRDRFKKLAGIL